MKNFRKSLDYVLDFEGGYSNHPNDNGGATNYGITIKVARDNGYVGDMRYIPLEVVEDIYYKNYYKKNNIYKLPDMLAFSVFDFAVNSGVKRAGITLQKALNNIKGGDILKEDGLIGKKTLEIVNSLDTILILNAFHKEQREFYKSIIRSNPALSVFSRGWNNRINKKIEVLKNWSK